ncbi:nucleotide disphospho-sugar-binding domain-containing protein [Actinoallomurus sp. NPDC052308]|uniref:nucleotide disphospho-sugar-binding domain-containing protein n=1 Tax=Actinoallomurus sp. NPDC052308 TaxID=3155530 RepID=UPI003436153B
MRVIFTTWAWPSHLYAMVPLAWACRAAGHDVLVATQPALLDTVRRTGLPVVPVGHDVDALAAFRDIALPPAEPAGGARPRGGPRVLGLFAALAESMVDDLIALGRTWQADLVVYEPTAMAGPLAAAALGVPAVRHLYGTDLLGAAGPFLAEALDPLRRKLGLGDVDLSGVATVDPCPAGLQVPVASRRVPMRYTPFNGPGTFPRPSARSGRPRVCVTWGTTPARVDRRLFLAGEVTRAIAGLDVDVVVAVTSAQRELLGELPREVWVVESAPLHLLLPECDLVVGHGGAGTILTAVANGLPMLLIPCLPDHVRHAARAGEAGAAVVLPARCDDAEPIRNGLTELLATPAHHTAAERLRRELAEQPTPAQVVGELERLVAAPSA